jgi:hypothetical protein
MRIAMQNNTNFPTISLDNLDTVTGGYHDPVEPPTPSHGSGDGPEGRPQGTLVSHLGAILNRFADLASHPAPKK